MSPEPRDWDPAAHADRLRSSYPDLSSGRFAVIADFEQASHAELFRLGTPSRQGSLRVDPDRGWEPTGRSALKIVFGGADDVLVANNANVTQWYLKRDWREYDLLLMQMHAPSGGLDVEVGIVAESNGRQGVVEALLPLQPGWNLVRLDLGEVAEHLPLDDITEIRWSAPSATGLVEWMLDDVILANNTADLFGRSDGPNGELFVRRRGRRWSVGAAGRFELGFGGGQIVQWYDLAGDPNRLNNLVANTILGPSPVVMPADEFSESPGGTSDFVELGETVIARQQVSEVSPVRVVVATEWRFARRGASEAAEQQPFQQWTYTIYPSGSVYCHLRCTTADGDWRPDDIGLAVSRAERGDLEFFGHPPAQLQDEGRLRHVCFASIRRSDSVGASLLFAMHDARRAPRLDFFREAEAGRVTLVASGGRVHYDADEWSALLCVWPPETGTGLHPANRSFDYSFPNERITISTGRRITNDAGDVDADGFNEQRGCHVLAAEGRRVSVELNGREQPLYSPAFVIRGTAGMEGWVYLDSHALESTGRDANGDLLFQVPQTVTEGVRVDVYLGEDTGEAAPPTLDTSF
ncbi:MAG: hypothetical protein JXB13_01480 [Phycisphaerae bacterium]|nr:hypothetical protein [Phycisphaerae bacterium]